MSNENTIKTITSFFKEIGIPVYYEHITGQTFLPGMAIRNGALIVDTEHLLYPGDLLHEAGHIAVTPAAIRKDLNDNTTQFDDANEMAAIAWSYAACRHLGIDPRVVFHEHGYRGAGPSLAAGFDQGNYLGVSLLDWYGMANYGQHNPEALTNPYPNMVSWLSQK